MIGTKISRYVITEKIGEGGMGSVWRAEDPLLGRDIALKFLPESLASSPDARKRFLREAKSASALRHSSIAAVFDAGEEAERIYIAFELVDGETVAEHISHGPLAVGDACRVAFDAAEALDHAHARGVLHRDVTSRNIMIDRESRVIVVDFGLALPQGATRVTHSGMAVGTAPYLAPEVITGKEGDARSDVYGLGVVLYEMLTGRLPFDAERSESLFYLIVHTDAEPPSTKREGIPAELDRIVMKALAKDPEERYQSAREFAKDLYSVLEAASERPPSDRWLTAPVPAPRAKPIAERRKRIATMPVTWIVVLAIAAAVVYGITKLTPAPEPVLEQAFASVAVLPFQSTGGVSGESNWLAEGIAEALATKLTSVSEVRVTPWFTSRNFRDMSRPLGEIAEDLNVEALVVGTVRQLGEQVLCTITVVNSKTESQWWAEEYKEPMDDLFDVQERIALGVARSVKGQLSGDEERKLSRIAASSVEAYEHYLRGSIAMRNGTPEGLDEALPFFKRAIELDAEFAQAYVGLGAVHDNRYHIGRAGGESLREAEDAFRRALELDPTSTGARRGLLRAYWEQLRSEDVLKLGKEAMEMDPDDVENLLTAGEAYFLGGFPDKAIPVLKRVIDLDPASEAAHWFLCLSYTWLRQDEDGLDATETYFRKFGDEPDVLWFAGQLYQARGELDVAEIYYNRSLNLFPGAGNTLIWLVGSVLYLDMEEEASAKTVLSDGIASLERNRRSYPDNARTRTYLAALYGMKGDTTKMRQELDQIEVQEGYVMVAAALARNGDISSATDILATGVNRGCNGMIEVTTGLAFAFPEGFFEHPDFQPALRALKELHDDLAARY